MKAFWIPMLAAGLTACTTTTSNDRVRPDTPLPEGFEIACEGDFDTAPKLMAGKAPVFPASTLANPDFVEDRKIRRLPLSWRVTTRFDVLAEGTTAHVRSDATEPKFFATHTNAAIAAWRFAPARRADVAVDAQCVNVFNFNIEA